MSEVTSDSQPGSPSPPQDINREDPPTTSKKTTYELSPGTLQIYADHSPFTKKEILKMHTKFHELSQHGLDKITHDELLQVEQMRANPFASRICELFSEDGSGILSFENFLNMMSMFSIHTRPEVKMVWAFACGILMVTISLAQILKLSEKRLN
ncbi:unnamed protein product [Calypogeia fissa]